MKALKRLKECIGELCNYIPRSSVMMNMAGKLFFFHTKILKKDTDEEKKLVQDKEPSPN